MNILVLSHTFPYPPNEGIKLSLYNLIKEFSKVHNIYLLSFIDVKEKKYIDTYITNLSSYTKKIFVIPHNPSKNFFKRSFSVFFSNQPYCIEQFFSEDFLTELNKIVSLEHFDIIFFNFITTAIYSKFIKSHFQGKKIIFLYDAVSMLFYRNFLTTKNFVKKYYWFNQYIKLLNFEFGLQKDFDKIVVVAQKDKDWLIEKSKVDSEKIVVIPNGVDTKYFSPKGLNFQSPVAIIFRGIMNFQPNEDACIYFLTQIFPLVKKILPEIKFYIVGPNPSKKILSFAKKDKNIVVTDYLEDIREYMLKSTINICPMISGSGIKHKILESMSMGIPTITTTIGSEGIPELKNFENILISDDPTDFAQKIVLLVKDKDLYKKIVVNGRKLIEEKYTWQIASKKFDLLFNSLRQNFTK
jgi:glycosyltransferase involved in cell wall biosynthesis